MSVTGFLRKLADGGEKELGLAVFQALMADDVEELKDIAEQVSDAGIYPEDFTYGLEALAGWRAHYYDKSLDLTPQQKNEIDALDDEWTVRLVQQLRYF